MQECAFCTKSAVKKGGEHVFSDWMNRILPIKKFRIRQETESGKKQYIKRSLDWKAPVVCEKCNNEWMSRLESAHAKPAMENLILSDKLTSLKPERLKSIANFAFKTAVIADHLSLEDRGGPFFTREARYSFAATLAIPRGVQMWISAFKEEGHGVARTVYHQSPADTVARFELYVLTFGAGFLLFQVVGARWLTPSMRGHPFVTQAKFWNKFSIPFWPPNGEAVLWPPNKQFQLRLIKPFITRWADSKVPDTWLKSNKTNLTPLWR